MDDHFTTSLFTMSRAHAKFRCAKGVVGHRFALFHFIQGQGDFPFLIR